MINIRYLNSDLIITVKTIRFVLFCFSFLYFSRKDEKEKKRGGRKKIITANKTRNTQK